MWLYIPLSHTLNSAPARECLEPPSNSPSNPSESEPSLFVTLSGKQSRRPLSWPGWKQRAWVRLLSGMTLAPSTESRGAASWIASVVATHVNRSPVLVSDLARKMSDTFGRKSIELLLRSSQHSVFSRTYQATLFEDSTESSKIWKDWITGLRRDCLHRRKSARRCAMSDYTSWPRPVTVTGGPNKAMERKRDWNADLQEVAQNWPLPKTPTGGANQDRQQRGSGGPDLQESVQNWMRVRATDSHGGGYQRNQRTGKKILTINGQVQDWPGTILQPETIGNPGELLQVWTPPECPRLNPRFAEWLMGWPRGLTSFDLSAMEWTRWRRQTLSFIYWLILKK